MSIVGPLHVTSVSTDLGWIALVGVAASDTPSGKPLVKQLVFGHATKAASLAAFDPSLLAQATPADWCPALVERLREFAEGIATDFRDVEVDFEHLTPFRQRVMKHCRAIRYGETQSYGDLAAKSGSARAARAVGSTMAGNRVPLIVPCHRVINSNGSTGQFSSPDGPNMKARLLAMEERATMLPGQGAADEQSPPVGRDGVLTALHFHRIKAVRTLPKTGKPGLPGLKPPIFRRLLTRATGQKLA